MLGALRILELPHRERGHDPSSDAEASSMDGPARSRVIPGE